MPGATAYPDVSGILPLQQHIKTLKAIY